MDHTLRWQKSSFSDGGEGNTCIELAVSWQKSTFSDGGNGNTRVELAASAAPSALHLRESDAPDTALSTTPVALAHLLAGIRTDLAPQRTTSKTFF
ncbi:DUF397 domain-containing protein [Streptomyces coriariae]|uniref:DUF397 domain-containing protein n=1 Tax=Streptomyces coriariae TaxID=2864460 RepID=UPI001E2B5EBE|nr:DUF397 domain-containing protein [Streptomyces coriariae]